MAGKWSEAQPAQAKAMSTDRKQAEAVKVLSDTLGGGSESNEDIGVSPQDSRRSSSHSSRAGSSSNCTGIRIKLRAGKAWDLIDGQLHKPLESSGEDSGSSTEAYSFESSRSSAFVQSSWSGTSSATVRSCRSNSAGHSRAGVQVTTGNIVDMPRQDGLIRNLISL